MAKTDYNQGMDEETARGIAQLLRKPEGEYAIEVGKKMNEGNAFINHKTFEFISIQPGDHLLEVGMGNGFFVKDILGKNRSIKYTGIDYSPEMVRQANDYNAKFIESDVVDFHLGNVNEMPFENDTFNHVFSINTIYFWDDHKAALSEIKRVLKTNGVLTLFLKTKSQYEGLRFCKIRLRYVLSGRTCRSS